MKFWKLKIDGTTLGALRQALDDDLLLSNFPNPFSNQTTIRFELKEPQPINISIFDLQGKLIKTLIQGNNKEGKYEIIWKGYNESGMKSPGGMYVCKLEGKSESRLIKIILR